ncbi:hypothetical protein G7011_00340 [Pseudomonas plecoglossicida]|uniref:hypothetical protein n=1 Tax=Pseudomonas plecoglossicida TaxID=70775 RepID=UPI0015E38A19|nr:hypothetical protein [Pseudomonas plecoglossicida]MBA1195561.1 hypothetical protein [Pseudomonas plecoglossicida]
MSDGDEIRAEFERRFPVPDGIKWDLAVGDYIVTCKGCWMAAEGAVFQTRREGWCASREALRVTNPFPVSMGEPEADWAREVAEKSLRAQGLKVIG